MSSQQPFVSILTPTYNRRRFIPQLIEYVKHQTYPVAKREWLVLDDGTDPVEDLLAPHIASLNIRYIRSEEKLNIGAKRNRLNKEARGEILVCMDDDDYYPPERVAYAVNSLLSHPRYQICGSSKNHIYFTDDNTIWAVGPYMTVPQGPTTHATFGTMAFTKRYAEKHPLNDFDTYAEEVQFTNRYKEPLLQLADPAKVMLVMNHSENTKNKNDLRSAKDPHIRKTPMKLRNFISSVKHREFYVGLTAALYGASQATAVTTEKKTEE